MNIVVISHAGCPDGVAAAWAIYRKFPKSTFHFTSERDITKDSLPDLTGKIVYIVDYSYPKEVLLELISKVKYLYLWDHHNTAIEDLSEIPHSGPNWNFVLDTTKCGAEITWEQLNLYREAIDSSTWEQLNLCREAIDSSSNRTRIGQPLVDLNREAIPYIIRPWFLKHIRDRDLWLWEDPNSRAFSQYFFEKGLTMETLDSILKSDPEEIYRIGNELLIKQQKVIDAAVARSEEFRFTCSLGVFLVNVVNQDTYQSEVGNALCTTQIPNRISYLKYDFAVVLRNSDSYRKVSNLIADPDADISVSLRGVGKIDLSRVAKSFGGGGHFNAAGFKCKLSKLGTILS